MNANEKTRRFENLHETLVAKWNRLAELRANGRYGYQLRMPKLAVARAAEALKAEFPAEARILRVM